MSYEKQTWQTGDVITAEKLNHMEDGIANGFFTATVTVANEHHGDFGVILSINPPTKALFCDENYNGYNYYGELFPELGQTVTGTFLCVDESFDLLSGHPVTVDGDATYEGFDEATDMFKTTVTGDCTITDQQE